MNIQTTTQAATTRAALDMLAELHPEARNLFMAIEGVLDHGASYADAVDDGNIEGLSDECARFCNVYLEFADELKSGDPFDYQCDAMREE